jgi:hypothetical protein
MARQTVRVRAVYHIGFAPKKTHPLSLSGEAFIDTADFEPVRVFTKLARRVPFVVRMALGTDISGFGYHIEFKRLQDGNYFPTSYGTEYELRLLFHVRACYLPAWQYWQPVLASFLRWQSTHPAIVVTLVVALRTSIVRTSP